jgi:ABC-2 type transport system permease protein
VRAELRAEMLKQRSTRTTISLLAAMLGLVLLAVLLHGFALSADKLTSRADQLTVLVGWGEVLGALFAGLLGAMSFTGEIRHGTIRPTFLATPRRERVIAAKLLAGAFTGLGIGVIAEGLAAAIEATGLSVRGLHIQLTASDYAQLIVGGAAVGALFATVGVGVGAVVRHQVSTIAGLCVWLLLIETTLIGNVPSAGKFTPGAAAGAIAGAVQTQSASKLVAPGVGVLLLAVYAAVAALAGALLTIRRDVA